MVGIIVRQAKLCPLEARRSFWKLRQWYISSIQSSEFPNNGRSGSGKPLCPFFDTHKDSPCWPQHLNYILLDAPLRIQDLYARLKEFKFFQLRLGTKFTEAKCGAKGNVGIDPHRSFFHLIDVRNTCVLDDFFQKQSNKHRLLPENVSCFSTISINGTPWRLRST